MFTGTTTELYLSWLLCVYRNYYWAHGWEIAVILRNFRKTKLSKSNFFFFFFFTVSTCIQCATRRLSLCDICKYRFPAFYGTSARQAAIFFCTRMIQTWSSFSRAWNSLRKRGFSRKWKSKIAEKNFFRRKTIWQAYFFFFFKTVRRCSRKYGNHAVNKCEFASKIEDWWSYRSWTFAYFKLFPWWKYTAGPDWSKKFVKPMNIYFAFEAERK